MMQRQLLRNGAAPVSPVRAEFLVPERLGHQLGPKVVHPKNHSVRHRAVGKAITWKIGHHDIKRIFSIASESRRVRQHRDYFREAIKRIGVAMRENQGKRVRALSALVDEMDSYAVYVRLVLCELIDGLLLFAPVVLRLPVVNQPFQIIEVGALIPVRTPHLMGPTRITEPTLQIFQLRLRYVDLKLCDFNSFHDSASGRRECADHRSLRPIITPRCGAGSAAIPVETREKMMQVRGVQTVPELQRTKRYSWRNATIGSTRMARRAGTYPASVATAVRVRVTIAIVLGSFAETPKSICPSRCAAPSAHGIPTATPANVNSSVSRSTIPKIALRDAPSATRIPIS